MGYLKLTCGQCSASWNIYSHGDYYREDARTCPVCGAQIEKQTWTHDIIPGFGQMLDTNRELQRDHEGYGAPLFQVEYIEPLPPNNDQVQLQALRLQVDDIEQNIAILNLLLTNSKK